MAASFPPSPAREPCHLGRLVTGDALGKEVDVNKPSGPNQNQGVLRHNSGGALGGTASGVVSTTICKGLPEVRDEDFFFVRNPFCEPLSIESEILPRIAVWIWESENGRWVKASVFHQSLTSLKIFVSYYLAKGRLVKLEVEE
jgi:hypothetical protein